MQTESAYRSWYEDRDKVIPQKLVQMRKAEAQKAILQCIMQVFLEGDKKITS